MRDDEVHPWMGEVSTYVQRGRGFHWSVAMTHSVHFDLKRELLQDRE
jgi:hypothetical protein